MTRDEGRALPEWLIVSRETLQRLGEFVGLVEKWNPAINLVSKRSLTDLWSRHVLDSAQLFPLIPSTAKRLVDLGSGGGFPGMILSILAHDAMPDLQIILVEANQRKATFLSEAYRQLDLSGKVLAQRIETLAPLLADVVTARALSPLHALCGYAVNHLGRSGVALFCKGAQVDGEIVDARKDWSFTLTEHQSRSDGQATILALRDLHHV